MVDRGGRGEWRSLTLMNICGYEYFHVVNSLQREYYLRIMFSWWFLGWRGLVPLSALTIVNGLMHLIFNALRLVYYQKFP